MRLTAPLPHVEHDSGKPTSHAPSASAVAMVDPTASHHPAPDTSSWPRYVKTLVLVLGMLFAAGFGVHMFATRQTENGKDESTSQDKKDQRTEPSISLVKGKPNTVEVPEDVRVALGIRKGKQDLIAIAQPPTRMRPLVLSGSTDLDPTRLARVRARFAPARAVGVGRYHDFSTRTGQSEFRELRPGDHVRKGQVLAVFYSVEVGSKKNDLLDSLVQLELDQKILDNAEKHREAVPEVFLLNATRAVQGDRNAINRALNNLKVWDIPQEEIDALHNEAKKISADKNAWFKTPEGRWVKGEKREPNDKIDSDKNTENPWGRVTLRVRFDGVIVERNLNVGEMVVDNTVNLFSVADVSRLLVKANAPEDELPTLAELSEQDRRWTVKTVGTDVATGVPGTIDEIGWLIDPNQHTAIIKGFVENHGLKIKAGQFVSAVIQIPPPTGVVEIPSDALLDDGQQSLVFVQTDPNKPQYTMRRVQVTHRFEQTVFVRSLPIPKAEQLTPAEAEEGLLPKEPLQPGERVIQSGAGELKVGLSNLQSQPPSEHEDEKHPER